MDASFILLARTALDTLGFTLSPSLAVIGMLADLHAADADEM